MEAGAKRRGGRGGTPSPLRRHDEGEARALADVVGRSKADGVPPYVVFHDRVLHEIADARPTSVGELAQIAGVGPAKLERYGDEVLALIER